MDDAAAVRVLQPVAVDVGDVGEVAARADRAALPDPLAHVAGGTDQLRVGIAHVEASHRAALEVPQDGPSGQGVVGVLTHGRHCTSSAVTSAPGRSAHSSPIGHFRRRDVDARFTVCTHADIRSDISVTTIGRTEPMLELAILGLLKEQPPMATS